jgi:hypothetical protein
MCPGNTGTWRSTKANSERTQLKIIGQGWHIVKVVNTKHKSVKIVAERRFTV